MLNHPQQREAAKNSAVLTILFWVVCGGIFATSVFLGGYFYALLVLPPLFGWLVREQEALFPARVPLVVEENNHSTHSVSEEQAMMRNSLVAEEQSEISPFAALQEELRPREKHCRRYEEAQRILEIESICILHKEAWRQEVGYRVSPNDIEREYHLYYTRERQAGKITRDEAWRHFLHWDELDYGNEAMVKESYNRTRTLIACFRLENNLDVPPYLMLSTEKVVSREDVLNTYSKVLALIWGFDQKLKYILDLKEMSRRSKASTTKMIEERQKAIEQREKFTKERQKATEERQKATEERQKATEARQKATEEHQKAMAERQKTEIKLEQVIQEDKKLFIKIGAAYRNKLKKEGREATDEAVKDYLRTCNREEEIEMTEEELEEIVQLGKLPEEAELSTTSCIISSRFFTSSPSASSLGSEDVKLELPASIPQIDEAKEELNFDAKKTDSFLEPALEENAMMLAEAPSTVLQEVLDPYEKHCKRYEEARRILEIESRCILDKEVWSEGIGREIPTNQLEWRYGLFYEQEQRAGKITFVEAIEQLLDWHANTLDYDNKAMVEEGYKKTRQLILRFHSDKNRDVPDCIRLQTGEVVRQEKILSTYREAYDSVFRFSQKIKNSNTYTAHRRSKASTVKMKEEHQKAIEERLKAVAERQKAVAERQKAVAERQKAAAERQKTEIKLEQVIQEDKKLFIKIGAAYRNKLKKEGREATDEAVKDYLRDCNREDEIEMTEEELEEIVQLGKLPVKAETSSSSRSILSRFFTSSPSASSLGSEDAKAEPSALPKEDSGWFNFSLGKKTNQQSRPREPKGPSVPDFVWVKASEPHWLSIFGRRSERDSIYEHLMSTSALLLTSTLRVCSIASDSELTAESQHSAATYLQVWVQNLTNPDEEETKRAGYRLVLALLSESIEALDLSAVCLNPTKDPEIQERVSAFLQWLVVSPSLQRVLLHAEDAMLPAKVGAVLQHRQVFHQALVAGIQQSTTLTTAKEPINGWWSYVAADFYEEIERARHAAYCLLHYELAHLMGVAEHHQDNVSQWSRAGSLEKEVSASAINFNRELQQAEDSRDSAHILGLQQWFQLKERVDVYFIELERNLDEVTSNQLEKMAAYPLSDLEAHKRLREIYQARERASRHEGEILSYDLQTEAPAGLNASEDTLHIMR